MNAPLDRQKLADKVVSPGEADHLDLSEYRFQRDVEKLWKLGPRATTELLGT